MLPGQQKQRSVSAVRVKKTIEVLGLSLPAAFALLVVFLVSSPTYAAVETYPYTENFDSGSFPADWLNVTTDDEDWRIRSGSTPSSNTGPSDDITGGGYYLYTETSGNFGERFDLLSPVFNFSDSAISMSSDALVAAFQYHMYGNTIGQLHIDISIDSGNTWNDDLVASWTDNANAWKLAVINLDAYKGQAAVQLRLRYISGTSFTGDLAIDDFSVALGAVPATEPSAYPTSFSALAGTEGTISVNWSDVNDGVTNSYWVVCSTSSSFSGPVDGALPLTDSNCSDGYGQQLISGTSVDWDGLLDSTQYFFTVYPVNASMGFGNFRSDASNPTASATASFPEPPSYPASSALADSDGNIEVSWSDLNDGVTDSIGLL